MGELLGTLGLAWPRLLLYPGGCFALGAAWLLGRWLAWCARRVQPPGAPSLLSSLIDSVPPLAALTLLPLAPARVFPFGLDLVVALALLEWPHLRRLASHAPQAQRPSGELAMQTLSLVRRRWPILAAGVGLAESVGGIGLSALLSWPEDQSAQLLLLISVALWLTGLAGLLGPAGEDTAGRLRALGLILIGALPLLGALAATSAPHLSGARAAWVLPPTAGLLAALAVGMLMRLPEAWRERLAVGLAVAAGVTTAVQFV